jgi:hypothetical protein
VCTKPGDQSPAPKKKKKLGVGVHTCNPRVQKAEAVGSEFEDSETLSEKKGERSGTGGSHL